MTRLVKYKLTIIHKSESTPNIWPATNYLPCHRLDAGYPAWMLDIQSHKIWDPALKIQGKKNFASKTLYYYIITSVQPTDTVCPRSSDPFDIGSYYKNGLLLHGHIVHGEARWPPRYLIWCLANPSQLKGWFHLQNNSIIVFFFEIQETKNQDVEAMILPIYQAKLYVNEKFKFMFVFYHIQNTVCPRSSNPFFRVSYYIKWVTTSWTYSNRIYSENN